MAFRKSDPFILDIQVTGAVRKYLDKQLSGNPVSINRKSSIGLCLYFLFKSNYTISEYDQWESNYSEKYPVSFTSYQVWHDGLRNVSAFTTIKFNTIFENEIKKECSMWVSVYESSNRKRKDAIEDFIQRYNFTEEEITFDSLSRYLRRYSNRIFLQSPLLWPHS